MEALDRFMRAADEQVQAREAAERKVREERLAEYRAEWERWVGADLLAELCAEWGWGSGYRPMVTVHYRGKSWVAISGDWTGADKLAAWLRETEAQAMALEQAQAVFLEMLPERMGQMEEYGWFTALRRQAQQLELEGHPTVREYFQAYEAERQAALLAEHEALVAEAVGKLRAVQSWDEFEMVLVPAAVNTDPRVIEVYQAARQRAAHAWAEAEEQQEREQVEREARRQALAEEAFFPFVYYELHYGVVATDESGQVFVGTERMDVLQAEPTAEGWWQAADGAVLRVAHPVLVKRVEVRERKGLPFWCPWIKTEAGGIQVPRGGVERL